MDDPVRISFRDTRPDSQKMERQTGPTRPTKRTAEVRRQFPVGNPRLSFLLATSLHRLTPLTPYCSAVFGASLMTLKVGSVT